MVLMDQKLQSPPRSTRRKVVRRVNRMGIPPATVGGAILGGTIGGTFGGPIGVVVGFVVGGAVGGVVDHQEDSATPAAKR